MISLSFIALALVAVTNPVLAHGPHEFRNVHTHRSHLEAREYITPETRLESYDYIIAGGGQAGLQLASRLSEDGTTTVLVLEAGGTGDDVRATVDSPGTTYFDGLLGSEFDYQYRTVPQPGAGDREVSWPRGKILGGSAAVNGMYLVRPSAVEVDSWHKLIANEDNQAIADSWTWDSLLESMKKTETFTPPLPETLEVAGMRFNADSHGTSGPIHATFPGYMVPISSAWLPTLAAAGVPTSEDAYSGNNLGGFFSLLAINPANWTRSYSKSAYIDNLPPRSNLHILANAAVTKILFADNVQDGDRVASGVEFARDASDTAQTVQATKEVILAGGAVGSPHMLLVSGVGPRDVLESANVPVVVDLPGVGNHMQDHLAVSVAWETEEETQGDIYNSETELARSPEFLSFVNSGTSYVSGEYLFDGQESFNNHLTALRERLNDEEALAPSLPSDNAEVNAGYRAIYQTLVDDVYPEAGLIEMLYSINAPGTIIIQAALQTPLSQGRLTINSPSIFDTPVIDPRYFTHDADIALMRQGLKKARELSTHEPLSNLIGAETRPGPDVQTDEQIEEYIRNSAGTEFHPGCTCAMLPLNLGGVVDASLKVYGTTNVRVVDGSVFPLSMSAHLMAPIYGLADKAADLILNEGGAGDSNSNGNSGTEPPTGGRNPDSAALGLHGSIGAAFTVASVLIGVLVL